MRRVLVTGANKGIGLAIVEAILTQHEDTQLVLGSRSAERGQAARDGLVSKNAQWADRIEVLEIDVSSDDSVAKAAGATTEPLYGIVNNAGVGFGVGSLLDTLQVNTYGMRRVCEAFLPKIASGGRIVNITSAAGPIFVAKCSAERKAFFLDREMKWPSLNALMEECLPMDGNSEAFESKGLGNGDSYGLSKACANSYTQILSRENPGLVVSACTPGFIETDLTRGYAKANNQPVADMGMKQPAEGTKSALFALFADLKGSGFYYGSDAVRSPMDSYRGPGDPEYTGN